MKRKPKTRTDLADLFEQLRQKHNDLGAMLVGLRSWQVEHVARDREFTAHVLQRLTALEKLTGVDGAICREIQCQKGRLHELETKKTELSHQANRSGIRCTDNLEFEDRPSLRQQLLPPLTKLRQQLGNISFDQLISLVTKLR